MSHLLDEKKKAARRFRNLNCLEELGFGPDSILMSDPKLFLDGAFLSIVTAEFRQELGEECSRQALLEIGRHHGICDANRTLAAESMGDLQNPSSLPLSGPNLVIQFEAPRTDSGELVLTGSWPEHHEARARLARLGLAQEPACALSAGYSAGWLAEIHDTEVEVVEISCRASGDERCRFEAHLTAPEAAPIHTSIGALETLPASPAEQIPTSYGPEASDHDEDSYPQIDPDDDAVHAWGPVMVLPFIDPRTAESTLLSLERDSLVGDIRVVVIDLRGQAIDDEASLVGIERVLKTLQRWSAQPVFSTVREGDEKLLRAFDSVCFVAHKKLPEAVAAAFQIADAQRHAL